MTTALLQQALDALIPLANAHFPSERAQLNDEDVIAADIAVTALRAAIAQPKQQKPTLAESAQWAEEVLTDADIYGIARRCDASINKDLRYLWLARAVLVQAGLKLPPVAQPVQPALQPLTAGMCLVPIEATPEMIDAAMANNYVHGDLNAARIVLRDEYRAMIAAHKAKVHHD